MAAVALAYIIATLAKVIVLSLLKYGLWFKLCHFTSVVFFDNNY